MTFKELYTKYYEVQKDVVRWSTLKTYRDRIKYIGMFDKVKLKDMDATHYQKWRAEMMKVDYDVIKQQAMELGMVLPTEQNTIHYEGTPSDYVRQYAEIPVTGQ